MGPAPGIDQLVEASRDLAGLPLTWSWQMLLVLGAAWLAIKFDRSHSAATRYRVWLIAFLVSAVLPLLSAICRSLPGPPLPAPLRPVSAVAIPTTSTIGMPSPRFFWGSLAWPILVALWTAGATVQLLRLCRSHWKLRLIRRSARPTTPAGCSLNIDWLAREVDMTRRQHAPIVFSSNIKSPGLTGLLRPVILLPADIATWTSPEERASILRHELAHIKRHDHLASLFQSLLKALFFFHPMVRYASNQLSVERELACDDRVLSMGSEPAAYAESILKAAERSFITDVVHQIASFASKQKLEGRIDMILDPNRAALPLRQWPFLILPLLFMGTITWLVMPAASGTPRPGASTADPGASATSRTAFPRNSQASAVLDRKNVYIDTVIRGDLILQVRALGKLRQGGDGRLLAALQVPEANFDSIRLGQPAAVDTGIGVVSGEVGHIYPEITRGIGRVDIFLKGELPNGAGSGLATDATIEIGRIDDVLNIGRPVHGQAESTISLFKLAEEGGSATRAQVRLGRASVNRVQILDGLTAGDKVIISDMSAYSGYDRITLE